MAIRDFAFFALAFLTLSSTIQAQIFYDNSFSSHFPGPLPTPDEFADDTPFTGVRHVGSFSFLYSNPNPGPVNATARFYSVSPAGGVGTLIQTVPITNLAPGSQYAAVNLDASQQFDWQATPGIYGVQGSSGGFFSLQFDTPNCGWYKSDGPISFDGFYDVTTGQFVTFQGDPEASFFLQISSSSPFPALAIDFIVPSIVGGQVQSGTVTIFPPRPTATVLKIVSSKPGIARVAPTVTVDANATVARITIYSRPVTADTPVTIAVQGGGRQKSATFTVTAN